MYLKTCIENMCIRHLQKILLLTIVIIVTSFVTSSHVHSQEDYSDIDSFYYTNDNVTTKPIKDPLEKLNRKTLALNNQILSKLKPRSQKITYNSTTTKPKVLLNNVFDNIAYPLIAVNFILQKEPEKALNALWRFFINSTLGIGGLFDIASSFEMEKNTTSFSETLNKYHIDYGIYIVLPLLGPKTIKDIVAFALASTLNPVFYLVSNKLMLFLIINTYNIYCMLDYLNYNSLVIEGGLDDYVRLRSLYMQKQ